MQPINQWARFSNDDDHYMGFVTTARAMLLDEITADGNTWLTPWLLAVATVDPLPWTLGRSVLDPSTKSSDETSFTAKPL